MNATIAHRYRELFAHHASGMLLGLCRGFAPDYKLRVIHVAFRGGFIAAGGFGSLVNERGEREGSAEERAKEKGTGKLVSLRYRAAVNQPVDLPLRACIAREIFHRRV